MKKPAIINRRRMECHNILSTIRCSLSHSRLTSIRTQIFRLIRHSIPPRPSIIRQSIPFPQFFNIKMFLLQFLQNTLFNHIHTRKSKIDDTGRGKIPNPTNYQSSPSYRIYISQSRNLVKKHTYLPHRKCTPTLPTKPSLCTLTHRHHVQSPCLNTTPHDTPQRQIHKCNKAAPRDLLTNSAMAETCPSREGGGGPFRGSASAGA